MLTCGTFSSLESAAPIKRTAVERQVNVHILFLFGLLLALSLGSTIGSSIRTVRCFNEIATNVEIVYLLYSGSFRVSNGICLKIRSV